MKAANHVHKFRRKKYKSGNTIFFCVLDCPFKVEAELALGKVSLCNICGAEFEMNEYTIKLNKPHCINCNKAKVTDKDGNKRFVRKLTGVIGASLADELAQMKAILDVDKQIEEEKEI